MLSREEINGLRERLQSARARAATYFNRCGEIQENDAIYEDLWADLPTEELRSQADDLRAEIKRLGVEIAGAARGSALIAEADLQDLRHNTRRMLASLRFRSYQHRGLYVYHDEGVVLGVDPPSQTEDLVGNVADSERSFAKAASGLIDVIDLLSPADAHATGASAAASYRPNTAFIMMAINKGQPELEDVRQGIKDVCKEFGITAITADEIEHDDPVTDRILEEIETCEFLVADLTGERPNVYYELGHAHANSKRVILYRKEGTKIHFDIAHRNCPGYTNVTNLKDQLRKRLETLTNKPQRPGR